VAYQSIDPSTGKPLQTFAELLDVQLEAALATASACFTGCRATSYAARAAVTARAAAILRERREDFAGSVTLEIAWTPA
jgi:succinate-semialdehyde dehydrogenase/glutarate-semialdehyde dehydrogenase